MAQYRASSPITGFSGHIPGAKWHVGSRFSSSRSHADLSGALSQAKRENSENTDTTHTSNVSNTFDFDGNPVPRHDQPMLTVNNVPPTSYSGASVYPPQQLNGYGPPNGHPMQQMPPQQQPFPNDGYPPQHQQYPQQPTGVGYAGYASHSNVPMSQSVHDLGNNMQHLSVHDASPHQQQVVTQAQNGPQQREPPRQESQSAARRSQSMPRRVRQNAPSDNDLFTGVSGGYWSEGQALRNLRRHEQMKGETASGNYGPRSRRGRPANSDATDEDRIPAPGYSGHMTEYHRLSIGKPFTEAAKESRKLMNSYRENFLNNSFASNGRRTPANDTQGQAFPNPRE